MGAVVNMCQNDDSESGGGGAAGGKAPLLSKGMSRKEQEERAKRAQKRKMAVQELVNTEKTYVAMLTQCVENYYDPLEERRKILSGKDHKVLFSDIKVICQLNEKFLNDMAKRYASWHNDTSQIGDLFHEFCPYFRMYQTYMNNYDDAMVLLTKMLEKKSFTEFHVQACQASANQPLQSLLILPIQRLPRYVMCLKEIVKNTEYDHPDLANLRSALETVEKTTALINERMKEFEARKVVRQIEARFSGNLQLVKPHRYFVKEGTVTKISRKGDEKRVVLFLFNDLMIYATGTDRLNARGLLPVDRAFFVKDIPAHKKYRDTAFEIYSSEKSFIVYTDNGTTKRNWIATFQKAIKETLTKPGATQQPELSAPLMIPDDFSDVCLMPDCGSKFSRVHRRHHCRYCGKLICGKCGQYRLRHRSKKNTTVKPVCKICFVQWKDAYAAPKSGFFEANDSATSDSETEKKTKK